MSSFISWFSSAIVYGTVIMYGALGEIMTEKSGHLNLGVPGIVFLGGFASFASAFMYENSTANPSTFLLVLIPFVCGFLVAALAGLLYSFMTVTLKANQNVTGLALTAFGVGIGTFGGAYVCKLGGQTGYASVSLTHEAVSANLHSVLSLGVFGEIFLSYGFMAYLAIVLAIVLHLILNKTRVGLNLRAVGENPSTADAAGINVTKYKYVSTCLGAGICGLGGAFYILEYCKGGWSTTNGMEALGWLAVALVIFATWRPINTIWGSYLFALLFWFYVSFPQITGLKMPNYGSDLLQMLPYLVTIVILVVMSLRKKKENQPPSSLGLSYFREER